MLNSLSSICDTKWITTENNFVHLQNYKVYSSCTCDLQSKSTTVLRATPKLYCFCMLQLDSAKSLDLFSLPVLFEDFKTYRIVHIDKSHHFQKTEWIHSTHVRHDCHQTARIIKPHGDGADGKIYIMSHCIVLSHCIDIFRK